jgi:cation diffusion facilitator family transporter
MTAASRQQLVHRALLLEQLSIGWMAVEGAVSIAAGVSGRSVALTGFGVDSAIELVSAAIVYRRFRKELRGADDHTAVRAERHAQVGVALTLFALAAYILIESALSLWKRSHPDSSHVGLAVACVALVAMPLLARAKLRAGRALNSRALIADAHESLACAWLSAAVVVGVGLHALLGWWWADPVAALVMVPLLFHEGREALEESRGGQRCGHDDD